METHVWVSRHPLNNTLAVFIHGIWGSRWVTWRNYVDFFQRLPNEKAALRSYDVFLFTYDTPLFGPEPPLRESVVEKLRMFLDNERDAYDTVVLVCHSQGGLLAKLYILEELEAGRGAEMAIDFIVTLNTPHRGANWRNPFILFGLIVSTVLNKIPVVRSYYLLRQLADMSPWSRNIRYLAENWSKYVSTQPGTATAHSRYICSMAICGLRDWLVTSGSAEGFHVDTKNKTFNGHSVDSAVLANYVGHLLAHHEPTGTLVKELEHIYSAKPAFAEYDDACVTSASTVMNGQGIIPAKYVKSRAECFAHEFKDTFARHPLRKLSLADAFVRYVRKTLQD